jgi:hypothetical protein
MNNREKVMLKVAGYKHDFAGKLLSPLILAALGAGGGAIGGAAMGLADGGGRQISEGALTGALGGGAIGAGVGAGGLLGGAISGLFGSKPNKEDIKEYNENPSRAYLIPGVGMNRLLKRRRYISNKADPSGKNNKTLSEVISPWVLASAAGITDASTNAEAGLTPAQSLLQKPQHAGAAIGAMSGVGILAALLSKRRTMSEQAEYERKSNGMQNLLPGMAQYNMIKALQLSNDVK